MNTATMGQIVSAVGFRATMNGTDTCPAMITRVWGEQDGVWTVNATLFPDTAAPISVTSVKLYSDEAAAREALTAHSTVTSLHWPERI
jgi:hypothetical protein